VSANEPLYARLLGAAWNELPAEIRAMHDLLSNAEARGTASVVRGDGPLARLVATLMRFPPSSTAVHLTVRFVVRDGVETWTRTFGTHSFSSRQYAGRGHGLLCERFGPFTFGMALVGGGGRLTLVPKRWWAFGVPLPMWLCTRVNAYESAEGRRFRFHVEIRHPFTGLIVRYEGALSSPQPL
jgi:Domain of unknown function (DUF4166)